MAESLSCSFLLKCSRVRCWSRKVLLGADSSFYRTCLASASVQSNLRLALEWLISFVVPYFSSCPWQLLIESLEIFLIVESARSLISYRGRGCFHILFSLVWAAFWQLEARPRHFEAFEHWLEVGFASLMRSSVTSVSASDSLVALMRLTTCVCRLRGF